MLDDMYSRFDTLAKKHGLFKVETIGDAYMTVGGLPEPQGICLPFYFSVILFLTLFCSPSSQKADHTLRVGRFALEAITSAAEVPIDRDNKRRGFVSIRVGFHSGSVVASVVGTTNPRYCLFGDTGELTSGKQNIRTCFFGS